MSSNNDSLTLKQLPKEERPRERLQRLGGHLISSTELIAIILGNGTKGRSALNIANEMICRFGSLNRMANATLEELCQIKGLGEAKAIKLKAAFSLATRLNIDNQWKPKIEKSKDAYNLIREHLENQSRELLIAIMLDAKSFVINWEVIAIGTLTQVLIHPREVFYPAIRHKAANIIISHNHPSGDLTPSKQDLEITRTLVSVGKLLGIPLIDHLIVAQNNFISLRERGWFPV